MWSPLYILYVDKKNVFYAYSDGKLITTNFCRSSNYDSDLICYLFSFFAAFYKRHSFYLFFCIDINTSFFRYIAF